MEVIVYKRTDGQVVVVRPSPEALNDYTIQEIAIKDVPAGLPFAIIQDSDLPSEPQEAWDIDDSDLSDGVGGESNEFS